MSTQEQITHNAPTSEPAPSKDQKHTQRPVRGRWFFFFGKICLGLALLGLVAGKIETYLIARHFKEVAREAKNEQEIAVALTKYIHERHRKYWASLEEQGLKDNIHDKRYRFLPYILDHGGICAQRALLLNVALRSRGIPARKLGIGVTDEYIQHLVTEAYIDGEWRVLDPTFGYAYRRKNGQLATAHDLAEDPSLLTRVVQADKNPHPFPYPVDKYYYHRRMYFNWYKLSLTRWLAEQIGPDAYNWVPPSIWNRPFYIAAAGFVVLAAIFFLCGWWRRRTGTKRNLALAAGG